MDREREKEEMKGVGKRERERGIELGRDGNRQRGREEVIRQTNLFASFDIGEEGGGELCVSAYN